MGKAIIMIHGRGPEPQQDALLQCWSGFLDPAITAGSASIQMVDYVALWGYPGTYQSLDPRDCAQLAAGGNPDVAAREVLQQIGDALRDCTHNPLAGVLLKWPDVQKIKDALVEKIFRDFAAATQNQFAIDVLNFFKDRPEIRTGARAQLATAIDAARAAGHEVLVLAHSFGTIVAYEAARQYQNQEIDTLVTFGAPLAWCYDIWGPAAPPAVADYVHPKVFPDHGLNHWVNVYDALDPVATGVVLASLPHLAPDYLDHSAPAVIDDAIVNPYAKDDDLGSHHDWRGYLESDPVKQALQLFFSGAP